MPELPEAEIHRRLAEGALDRTIVAVLADDSWYLKRGLTATALDDALVERRFIAARRVGKAVLLDVGDGGPTLCLRFGMSGRLLVDGAAGVDDLAYASNRELERWDRFAVRFEDGGDMRLRDPRRLGGVELDPDEGRWGPDAVGLTPSALAAALGRSTAPLKARLMSQERIAGIGNLIADELLWRASLDPTRPAGSLSQTELRRLHRHLQATMRDVVEGGSHTGRLMVERRTQGVCPRDGAPLLRRTVGGRTTWSCPQHQV